VNRLWGVFRLADHFKQPDIDVILKMPHRRYLAWHAYLDESIEHPGKSEWYLMRVAAEVRNLFNLTAGKSEAADINTMKVKRALPETPEERAERAKRDAGIIKAALGLGRKAREIIRKPIR
jgi:hypothetical protein